MIAVADASPICYLVLIGEIELLPKLFREVLVPRAVIEELLAEGAPAAARSWASALPAWVQVRETPAGAAPGLGHLYLGERAAILLADSMNVELVLLDEKAARLVAAERGLRVAGVPGVLAAAANLGLVDLPAAVDRLTKTSFRCSPALLKSVLDRFPSRYGRPQSGRRFSRKVSSITVSRRARAVSPWTTHSHLRRAVNALSGGSR